MSYNDIIHNTSHISEKNILSTTKKDASLAFIEVFKNSLEAIKLKNEEIPYKGSSITVSIYVKENILKEEELDYIEIEDTGIGFNEDGFVRFCQFMNTSKGFNNKGTARFFLLKSFKKSVYDSTFEKDNKFCNIVFDFSTDNSPKDMYIKIISEEDIDKTSTGTSIKLYPADKDQKTIDIYKSFLRLDDVKKLIIDNFLLEFILLEKENFPRIEINRYKMNKKDCELKITRDDFPLIDKEENLEVPLYQVNNFESKLEESDEIVAFSLYSAKSKDIKRNEIILTSNNQKVETLDIQNLLPSDNLDNDERLLMLVKSDYLDDSSHINNERQKFDFYKRKDIEKELKNSIQANFKGYEDKYLFKDDVENNINKKIEKLYPEINILKNQKNDVIEKLKNRFLISDAVFEKVSQNIGINPSPEKVLFEVYSAEAETLAKKDAEISNKMDEILLLEPSSENYIDKINNISSEIVKLIPLQNRNNLAQYIARRKLVLNVLENILERKVPYDIKEKHIHNLFLVQHKDNSPEDSNLWMINEDFIYFSGKSEEKLCDFEINGSKVFKKDITEEEERYLKSLGENRKIKRPDILLFPEEHKCVIIEFKNLGVNVSEHLSQINKYAYWLRNFTNEGFNFLQFFGYLIGEDIEIRDVRAADGDFKPMYSGTGMFRPRKNVPCDNNASEDGELYTEIMKYSELLKRANTRNSIFLEKLGLNKR